ncbi:hypothetical protein [Variovorax saccharolyticus]|uniref:hypothetical protein n=1 Tax=Variovorax saccharolyticus TaxID=3053516 RepID=UPI002576A83A|nr:hypothetical protein [Variovorax sp. J31P216]MDM0029996.1 hypothetical protein [Variovorax sp. J31P216]
MNKEQNDILILGTGYFAEVILMDLAVATRAPIKIVIGGRNEARLKWLALACNSRAAQHGNPVRFHSSYVDMASEQSMADALGNWDPGVVVQSASLQSPWSLDGKGSEWAKLMEEAGFGLAVAFQSILPMRTSAALDAVGSKAAFVNTAYPDVVNQILAARGQRITCGVGNVAIFSSILAGALAPADAERLRVIAHHHALVQWRYPVDERVGDPVRAWIGDDEIPNVKARFSHIQLPHRELNLISGGSAVPVLLSLAGVGDSRGHVPGPHGLPGGYPVWVTKGDVRLDLPTTISKDEAVSWNRSFEAVDGVSVSEDGHVDYSERARVAVARYSQEIAKGFHVRDLVAAQGALAELRAKLGG